MIIVYTGPGCSDCFVLKRWLKMEGIPFEERDALESVDYLRGEGARALPSALIDGKIISGWYYIKKYIEETPRGKD